MHELWLGPSPTMNALTCWNFANVMKVGDIVFAKQGKRKVVGYGVVSGDYLFDDKRQSFKSTRRVTHDRTRQQRGERPIENR